MEKKLNRWAAWMDRQGFYVVLLVCVTVIAGSALWARVPISTQELPAQTVGQDPAFIDRLAEMTRTPEPTAVPTPTPEPPLTYPLTASSTTLRSFSPTTPLYQPTLDAYAVHPGLDLAVEQGQPVQAMADGIVSSLYTDPLHGLCLEIDHGQGRIARFAGLRSASVTTGDNVRAGQTVAAAGGKHPAEALDPPHLHVEWLVNGQPEDPAERWE
jgi:murein DD-endopeptidase MepM/ murein hydrolase activator NlpD